MSLVCCLLYNYWQVCLMTHLGTERCQMHSQLQKMRGAQRMVLDLRHLRPPNCCSEVNRMPTHAANANAAELHVCQVCIQPGCQTVATHRWMWLNDECMGKSL